MANSGSVTNSLIDRETAVIHLNDTLNEINESTRAIGTGAAFLQDGAIALNDAQLLADFSDAYFLEIGGGWDWIFLAEGLASSVSLPRPAWTEGNQAWSVENGTLCRSLGGEMPCVTVYRRGNIYKFSRDGIDGTDDLETWTIRRIRWL